MEFDSKLIQDESAIDFGGDGTEFDFTAGFDDVPEHSNDDTSPTTDEAVETQDSDVVTNGDNADETDETPTTESDPSEESDNPLTFKVKIDHQEQDITLSPDDLPTMYQKAANMDRANQRAEAARQEADRYKDFVAGWADVAKTLGFEGSSPEETIQAMLSGVTESAVSSKVNQLVEGGTAQEVAEYVVKQQLGLDKLPTLESAAPEESSAAEVDDGPPSPEQFSRDLQVLLEKRPDLGASGEPFPDEVLQAYMQGENLTVAYLDYEAKHTAAEREVLEKQNRIYKQNQESAARAPVKGVQGSGATGGKEDFWTAGFDDPTW